MVLRCSDGLLAAFSPNHPEVSSDRPVVYTNQERLSSKWNDTFFRALVSRIHNYSYCYYHNKRKSIRIRLRIEVPVNKSSSGVQDTAGFPEGLHSLRRIYGSSLSLFVVILL